MKRILFLSIKKIYIFLPCRGHNHPIKRNNYDRSENSLEMISMTSLGSLGICFRFLKGELGGNSYPLEDTFRVADPNGIYIFYRSGACLNLSFAVHQRISHIMQERFADLTCIYSVCINWPLSLKVKGQQSNFNCEE